MHACDGTMTVFPQALTALNRRWDLVAERRGHRGVRYGVEGPAQRVHAASLRETLGDALAARCFLLLRFFLSFLLLYMRRLIHLRAIFLLLSVMLSSHCNRLDNVFLCFRVCRGVICRRSAAVGSLQHDWCRFLRLLLRRTYGDGRRRIPQRFFSFLSYARFRHVHVFEHGFDL